MEKRARIADGIGMAAVILLGLSIPLSTPLDAVLVAVVILAWIAGGRYRDKIEPLRRNPVVLAALILFGAYLAGSLYSIADTGDVIDALGNAGIFLLIPVFMHFFSHPLARRWALDALLTALGATLVLSWLVWLELFPQLSIITGSSHAPPVFTCPITHSILMAFGAYLFAVRALHASGRPGRTVCTVLSLAALFTLLFMVHGRAGQVVLPALMLLFLYQTTRWKGLAAFLALVALAGGIAWHHQDNALYERATRAIHDIRFMESPVDGAPDEILRLTVCRYSRAVIQENPFFGVGTGGFPKAYAEQVRGTEHRPTDNPHNDYLMVAVQLGLFGLLCYALLFLTQWRYAPRLEDGAHRMIARGLVVTVLAASLVSSTLTGHTEGLLYAWMTALLFAGTKSRFGWKARQEDFRRHYRSMLQTSGIGLQNRYDMKLSVVIIVKNEEAAIEACLESVAWADEIVVLDSGSSDRTVEICRRYTERVYETDWPGFGPQKNRALEMATGDWILSIDADEHISPELKEELLAAIDNPDSPAAFAMPRRSSYCGRPMHHSGWWPDYVTRLVRRGSARFSDDLVHERLLVDGTTERLVNPILHDAFESLEDVIDTMNRYSTAGARMMERRGEEASLARAVSHGLWNFFHTYIIRGGFLDGREGFMLAVSNAEGTYYRYAKRLLHKKRDQQ